MILNLTENYRELGWSCFLAVPEYDDLPLNTLIFTGM